MSEMPNELSEQLEENVKPLVNKLVPFFEQPNNPLHSKSQSEKEALDFLTDKPTRDRFDLAFMAIADRIKGIADPKELKQFAEECTKISERFADNEQSEIKPKLIVSDATITLLYQCGSSYFESKQFKEASDIYFFLTYLKPENPNLWIALGLADWKNGQKEEAIESFIKASDHAVTLALPWVYIAQCQADMNMWNEAREAIAIAKEIADAFPQDNPPSSMSVIDNLASNYKNK